ncbi:D-alanyl-D-alanine carboxypeptidase (penicillin-binding protein 5/6) [Micromonospora pisi]|uniref:D-alanyl-D-alanine carboxypeptidase (Penicillin-binding protein 5/6) n=1 Tax=Micromonospora pisi TaxID=589240 RepID=A0A495JB98_9ACTN|nr:serine hydrolase [Micromonospora pisi]RKR86276.1 D-alanyl-D-alanine carboxypeptidase (penicillin-binding protein 5/6) [Micromonospora pisi]
MRGRRLLAAVTGVVLAATALPVSASAVATAVPVSAVGVAPTSSATVAPSTPPVPCPVPTPPVPRPTSPPRPKPPADDPVKRAVGGPELATSGLVVAPGSARPPAVSATSWLVADLDTGAVLGGCGPHEYGTPASVQKLLLTATVLPKLDPKQVVTVTRKDLDFEQGSSAVGLLLNGRYSIETLWLGLLLNSGNDAANVLARLAGGDAGVAGTLEAMNERARELGALQTHAVTPSGLDAPGQFTSAYDLALIARACFAEETFVRYEQTERAQIPAQPPKKGFQIQNDNQLLFNYRGAIGGKTGFTDLARHTYVGAAERDGRRLVVTLLGAEARPLRGWQQGAALLDWGFALPRETSVGRLVDPGEATATPSPSPASTRRGGASTTRATARSTPWWSGVSPTTGVGLGAALAVAAVVTVVALLVSRQRGPQRPVGRRRRRRQGIFDG